MGIVIARSHSIELNDLTNHGVMVVSTGWVSSRNITRIIREQNHWRVSTTNETFLPYGVSRTDALSIRSAVKSMTTLDSVSDSTTMRSLQALASNSEFVVPSGSLSIRVLGPVQVFSTREEVKFRKAKSLELLCWLAFHRDCPTVSGARTALWEIDVKDATFHNVLSELRYGLNAVGFPETAGRMSKHRLFLDPRIVTDSENLRDTLIAAESKSCGSSIRRLQQLLVQVRGLPFSSVNYVWADAEGITSTLVWRVTRAVEFVARVATAAGDRTALLDAIAAGLRMSPGDERFLALQESSAA
jgi:two-component SAPR family response regulator